MSQYLPGSPETVGSTKNYNILCEFTKLYNRVTNKLTHGAELYKQNHKSIFDAAILLLLLLLH